MANIIIRSEERRQREAHVMYSFGHNPMRAGAETREQAEVIAEGTQRAYKEMKKREEK